MPGRNVRGIASFICSVGARLSDTVCHADFSRWTSCVGDRPDLTRGFPHPLSARDHRGPSPCGELLVDISHQLVFRMDVHRVDYRAGLGAARSPAVWVRVDTAAVLQSLAEVFCDGIERPAV